MGWNRLETVKMNGARLAEEKIVSQMSNRFSRNGRREVAAAICTAPGHNGW